MESLNPELALCGSINECNGTNTVLFPASEVSTVAASLCTFNLKCEDPNLAEIFTDFLGNLQKVDLVVEYDMKKILYKTLLIVTK